MSRFGQYNNNEDKNVAISASPDSCGAQWQPCDHLFGCQPVGWFTLVCPEAKIRCGVKLFRIHTNIIGTFLLLIGSSIYYLPVYIFHVMHVLNIRYHI